MSLPSDLVYSQSSSSQQLHLNANSKNIQHISSLMTLETAIQKIQLDVYVSGELVVSEKVTCVSNEPKVDFIEELLSEIAHKILKMLDTKSLGQAARVSKKWKNMCQSELLVRKYSDNSNVYYEKLWQLLHRNIKETSGKSFPFE